MHGLKQDANKNDVLMGIIILDAVIAIVGIAFVERSKTVFHALLATNRSLASLRSQSPSARKFASVIATVFVEIRLK
jgi:hypothetical protein